MWTCIPCKRFWHYPLKRCAYCGKDLAEESAKTLTVIGVTEVLVPSVEHPDVPYFVLLLEDEKGFRHLRKSMDPQKVGDVLDVKPATNAFARIGIIGTGAMASGIAMSCLKAGMPVIVKSRKQETLNRFQENIALKLKKNLSEEAVNETLTRLELTTDYAKLKNCDIVIENVIEKLDAKQDVFEALEKHCGPNTILATNTSSLLVSSLAPLVKKPERVIGLHFFNPVEKMRLAEVIAGENTSMETVRKTREIAEAMGKTAVQVKDAPGFIVNRVLFPFLNEAVLLLENETANAEDIDAAVKMGLNHPMGPLALIDLIGVDVFVEIMDNLKEETKEQKFEVASLARKMVKEGKLGRKTRQGFYAY
ncbi:3-hydroxyacyl-CoA dehydrogenase family protein [Candidatus Micrarchaeota archaeon]|nr:3-hydroxyacyl-CoA dehydrogenase family protein [Candidatus Micrarchaeota archaeon]